MTYRIDLIRKLVIVNEDDIYNASFDAIALHTWQKSRFLDPAYWTIPDGVDPNIYRIARDELIERGLIEDKE